MDLALLIGNTFVAAFALVQVSIQVKREDYGSAFLAAVVAVLSIVVAALMLVIAEK